MDVFAVDFTTAPMLAELFSNVDVFFAVFVRIMGLLTVLPVLSGQNLPVMARITLALGIALLAFVANVVTLPPYDLNLLGYGLLLVTEFMSGLIIGLIVMLFFSVFHFIGQLTDFQMGFGMVNVMDPFGNQQTPITGNFYYLIISLFFVSSGALRLVLANLFHSFNFIGLGEAVVTGNAGLTYLIIDIFVQYFRTGFTIALPVIGTLMLVDITLGILVKAVPKMNVFVIGLPIKVMVGLIIVFLTLPFMIDTFEGIMINVNQFIVMAIEVMIPSNTEYIIY